MMSKLDLFDERQLTQGLTSPIGELWAQTKLPILNQLPKLTNVLNEQIMKYT